MRERERARERERRGAYINTFGYVNKIKEKLHKHKLSYKAHAQMLTHWRPG